MAHSHSVTVQSAPGEYTPLRGKNSADVVAMAIFHGTEFPPWGVNTWSYCLNNAKARVPGRNIIQIVCFFLTHPCSCPEHPSPSGNGNAFGSWEGRVLPQR